MSHHRKVEATLRITNDGEVAHVHFTNPITGKLQLILNHESTLS